MNPIQTLDQADAIKASADALRQALDLYRVAMDFLAEVDRHDLEEELASTSGVVAADITILGNYLRELETATPDVPKPCVNAYHLDHLRKHGGCPTCGETED